MDNMTAAVVQQRWKYSRHWFGRGRKLDIFSYSCRRSFIIVTSFRKKPKHEYSSGIQKHILLESFYI